MIYQTLRIQGRKGGAIPLIPADFQKKEPNGDSLKAFFFLPEALL